MVKMHSRIIQISDEPIVNEVNESMFYEDFVGTIADYVDGKHTDVVADYKQIFGNKEAFALNVENATVTITNKEAYFKPLYSEWQKSVKKVSAMSFDQFCTLDKHYDIWCLGQSFDEKYDIYVSDWCGWYETFTTWMRGTENGKTYYLGPTIDYHR